MLLYRNIKTRCKASGISVSELERILEFPRSSICKWDKNVPGIKKIKKVAEYFGVPIEKLLE